MKSYPKVSIVTVTYNCVDTIEKTLLNVLNQTYSNLEYIVIDGASTDGTREVIERYANRLSYWISEPDKGIYEAMNKGIKAATGEWIFFLNSGDFFFKPQTIQNVFEWYEDKGEDLIVGGIRSVNHQGVNDAFYNPANADAWHRAFIPHQSAFIRLSVQKANPYLTKYKIASDYAFFLKQILRGCNIALCKEIISIYDSEFGISSTNILLAWQERTQIRKELGAPFKLILKSEIRCLRIRLRNLIRAVIKR